jgi:glutamate transport system ATP-binding protein
VKLETLDINPFSAAAHGADVELVNVTKQFGSHTVLQGVSLTVHSGTVVAVIGPSGSGKSTLCRIVAGLEPFQEGEVRLDGYDFLRGGRRGRASHGSGYRRSRLRVGMVFQSSTLFPQMTVLDNIMLGPQKVLKLSRAVAMERASTILERVGLSDKLKSYPAHLSGGQQQRAAIARELAMDRRLILFDEVTSALDPELVREVLTVMRELARGGLTMIVVTHEMNFARTVSDEGVFMDNGSVVESGAPAEFFDRPKMERTRSFLDRVLI